MRRTWLALVPLLGLGCGPGRPDGPAATQGAFDPDGARATLTAALDAWKRGEGRGLSRRTPPIRFADDDFAAGFKLDRYEEAAPAAPIAAFKDVPVILSLRDRRGNPVRREVAYQVATSPGLAVLRSDP